MSGNLTAKMVWLTAISLLIFGQTPDFDTTGRYAVNYRTANIPGYYETMNNSRIYYPDSAGQVPGSCVPCPIIVFGHGFMMGIDRYYSYA